MPNEHIEYFKRFSAAYMRWVNFEFDRIVDDVIKKDARKENERKKALKAKMLMAGMPEYIPLDDIVFDFDSNVGWGVKVIDVLNL